MTPILTTVVFFLLSVTIFAAVVWLYPLCICIRALPHFTIRLFLWPIATIFVIPPRINEICVYFCSSIFLFRWPLHAYSVQSDKLLTKCTHTVFTLPRPRLEIIMCNTQVCQRLSWRAFPFGGCPRALPPNLCRFCLVRVQSNNWFNLNNMNYTCKQTLLERRSNSL